MDHDGVSQRVPSCGPDARGTEGLRLYASSADARDVVLVQPCCEGGFSALLGRAVIQAVAIECRASWSLYITAFSALVSILVAADSRVSRSSLGRAPVPFLSLSLSRHIRVYFISVSPTNLRLPLSSHFLLHDAHHARHLAAASEIWHVWDVHAQ